VYAPDLITESSKSVLASRIRTPEQCAGWLNETLDGLGLNQVYLCGLSIGGWHAANYAMHYPGRVKKLVLLSPIQTLARMHPWFFLKIMRMGFHPTRANVEKYIGWGRANEAPLPESVIEQFTISVLNINPNAAFPRMIKRQSLRALEMPVMVLLGENEYSFDVGRALSVAEVMIRNATVEVIPGASHLISVSRPDIVNGKVLDFLRE
jgi:pimeloyl-ACP methyl ester carboxylesterase